jgi:hypothetical protein
MSRERPPYEPPPDEGLTGTEYLLYTLLFLAIPIVNVLVSSILYYTWRSSAPKKANQINTLGFIIFGLHVVLTIVVTYLRGGGQ